MARKLYGIGLNLGFGDRGFLSTVADKRLVLDDFKALLLTDQGERINNPDFGVGLERYLFEPNDNVLIDVLKKVITTQTAKYLPIVTILNILFIQKDNQVNCKILFTIKDIGSASEVLEIQRDIQKL